MEPIKPTFSRNEEVNKTAFLNWRMESSGFKNFLNLANGYFESSIILTEKCLSDNIDKKADVVIFPILTSLNHGIELYFKGLTILINQILETKQKNEGTHNLKQLFGTLKARIKDLDGQKGLNHFEEKFKVLHDYIEELFDKIEASDKNDKMDFSRYPYSKKYENHFYVDKWLNVEIDLENLLRKIEVIYQSLEVFSDYLQYSRDIE